MELKLAYELASVEQYHLFLVLLDLSKSYKNMDRGQILKTLVGFGAGPNMWGLLEGFWALQEAVTHQNGFHGPQF